jgi:hypothetical protein
LTVSQKGITKELRIYDPTKKEERRINIAQLMSKKIEQAASVTDMYVKLPGMSISIVDESPKERLLITVYEILANFNYETKPEGEYLEAIMGVELKVTHV